MIFYLNKKVILKRNLYCVFREYIILFLKKDFMEHLNKLNKHKKKMNYKNSEIIMDISKNIEVHIKDL